MGDSLGDDVIVPVFGVEVAGKGILSWGGIEEFNKVLGAMSETIVIVFLKRGSVVSIVFGVGRLVVVEFGLFSGFVDQILFVELSALVLVDLIASVLTNKGAVLCGVDLDERS